MKKIHLIVVGKLTDSHIKSIEEDYFKRLKFISLTIHEIKSQSQNIEKESQLIEEKIAEINLKEKTSQKIILMTEMGKSYTSLKFAHFIEELGEDHRLIFIIGGAAGFKPDFKEKYPLQFSLSNLTFPHMLARLLFVEQLYRAQTILTKHPYHK